MRLVSLDIEAVSPDPSDRFGALAVFKPQPPVISLLGFEVSGQVHQQWWPTQEDHEQAIKNLAVLLDRGFYLFGWNLAGYDFPALIRAHYPWRDFLYEAAKQRRILDGQDLSKRVDQMLGMRTKKYWYGLEAVCERYGIEVWKDGVEYQIPIGSKPASLLHYHEKDLRNTTAVGEKLLADAREIDIQQSLEDAAAGLPFMDSYLKGWPIDKERLQQAWDQAIINQAQTLRSLRSRFGPKISPEMMRSHVQMSKFLFKELGYPSLQKTDSGADSASSEVIKVLSLQYPELADFAEWKKYETRIGRFYEATWDALQYTGTGCVHPSARLAGTYTGRSTYSSFLGRANSPKNRAPIAPPMHQIENGPYVRQIFVADEDRFIAEHDVGGQEMRLLAWLANDKNMLDAFNQGKDLHSLQTATMFNRAYTDVLEKYRLNDVETNTQRKLGKEFNLAGQYRIGWRKMQWRIAVRAGLWIKDWQAKKYQDDYHQTWPNVKQFWEKAVARGRSRRYVDTAAGRRVKLDFAPGFEYSNDQTAINTPIQGTGGDMKIAIINEMLDDFHSDKTRMYLEMHDGIFFSSASIDDSREVHQRLNNINWEEKFNVDKIPVHFDIETSIGTRWSELKGI